MFPVHPSIGYQFIGTRGRLFEWDGAKWKKGKPKLEARIIAPRVEPFWPSDPIVGEQVTDALGRRWQWDGEKWIGVAWVAREIEGPPGPQGPPGPPSVIEVQDLVAGPLPIVSGTPLLLTMDTALDPGKWLATGYIFVAPANTWPSAEFPLSAVLSPFSDSKTQTTVRHTNNPVNYPLSSSVVTIAATSHPTATVTATHNGSISATVRLQCLRIA